MTKPQPGEAPEEYSSGSLRACAMTLNVFVNEEDDPRRSTRRSSMVMHAHPNRAIVVRLREDSGTLTSRVLSQMLDAGGPSPGGLLRRDRVFGLYEPAGGYSGHRLRRWPRPMCRAWSGSDPPGSRARPTSAACWRWATNSSWIPSAPARPHSRTCGFWPAPVTLWPISRGRGSPGSDNWWLSCSRITASGGSGTCPFEYSGAEPSAGARYMQAWLRSRFAGRGGGPAPRRSGWPRGRSKAIRIDPPESSTYQIAARQLRGV